MTDQRKPSSLEKIYELARVALGKHDVPCERAALAELIEVSEFSPALVVLGSTVPRLTAEGAGMVAELVETWEVLAT